MLVRCEVDGSPMVIDSTNRGEHPDSSLAAFFGVHIESILSHYCWMYTTKTARATIWRRPQMDNKVSSRYEHIKAKASTMREQRLRLAAAYPNPKICIEFQRLRLEAFVF